MHVGSISDVYAVPSPIIYVEFTDLLTFVMLKCKTYGNIKMEGLTGETSASSEHLVREAGMEVIMYHDRAG
jgi:hypothetical protein